MEESYGLRARHQLVKQLQALGQHLRIENRLHMERTTLWHCDAGSGRRPPHQIRKSESFDPRRASLKEGAKRGGFSVRSTLPLARGVLTTDHVWFLSPRYRSENVTRRREYIRLVPIRH